MRAYHFVGQNLRDGQAAPEDGEWLAHPDDALQYAQGTILRLAECEEIHARDDKFVCRKIIARCDATELLRQYARWCALQVVDLWDAPEIVLRYLETGDENLRADAEKAAQYTLDATLDARAAARAAARDSAWDAARAAARDSALAAARNAAWDAAWASARAARGAASRALQRAKLKELVDAKFSAMGVS